MSDRNDKNKKAEYLFSELGGIDDRILAEAEGYTPAAARRGIPFFRYTLIAACIVMSVMLVIAGIGVIAKIDRGKATAPESPGTLNAVLEKYRGEGNYTTVTEDGIDYLDGRIRLVWQYPGSEEYCVAAVSNYEAETLYRKMSGKSVGTSDGNTVETRFWITLGDGKVITPYLKESAGNIGYCELFGYSPELDPGMDFANAVSEIIG